jgi:3-oxoacyl-[acyl-carrier protein] reductase
MKRFENKVAVITGSGRGLGAATALRLAREGAHVAVNDLNAENVAKVAKQVEELGRKVLVSTHDISQHGAAKALMDEVKSKFGRLDVLVNNAGVTRDAMLHKLTEEKFDEVIRINLKGVFNCAQAAAAHMVAQSSGRIINLASIAALGNIGQTNYSASKAAVIGMTRTMALELSKYSITVNAIAPGLFESALTQAIPPEVKEKFIQRIPMRRIGNPDEIGALVAFLGSDEAAYLTGQTFFIDGGLSVGVSGI